MAGDGLCSYVLRDRPARAVYNLHVIVAWFEQKSLCRIVEFINMKHDVGEILAVCTLPAYN